MALALKVEGTTRGPGRQMTSPDENVGVAAIYGCLVLRIARDPIITTSRHMASLKTELAKLGVKVTEHDRRMVERQLRKISAGGDSRVSGAHWAHHEMITYSNILSCMKSSVFKSRRCGCLAFDIFAHCSSTHRCGIGMLATHQRTRATLNGQFLLRRPCAHQEPHIKNWRLFDLKIWV